MLCSARVPDYEHAFFYFQRPEVQQNQGFTAGFLQATKEPQHPVSVLQPDARAQRDDGAERFMLTVMPRSAAFARVQVGSRNWTSHLSSLCTSDLLRLFAKLTQYRHWHWSSLFVSPQPSQQQSHPEDPQGGVRRPGKPQISVSSAVTSCVCCVRLFSEAFRSVSRKALVLEQASPGASEAVDGWGCVAEIVRMKGLLLSDPLYLCVWTRWPAGVWSLGLGFVSHARDHPAASAELAAESSTRLSAPNIGNLTPSLVPLLWSQISPADRSLVMEMMEPKWPETCRNQTSLIPPPHPTAVSTQ